uniref:Uncharacterized protein n=1 Tax=Parastrongyloides trichosuri TaxID=131310 RepID=A0A0N4ZX20_PARTI
MYNSVHLETIFHHSTNTLIIKKREEIFTTTTSNDIESSEEVEMNEKGDYESATDLLEYLIPIFFVMILILWALRWVFHCYTKSRRNNEERFRRIRSNNISPNVNRVFPTQTEDPLYNARTHAQMYGQYGGIFFQPTPPKYDEVTLDFNELPPNHSTPSGPPPYPRTPSTTSVRELRVESLSAPPNYSIEEISDV